MQGQLLVRHGLQHLRLLGVEQAFLGRGLAHALDHHLQEQGLELLGDLFLLIRALGVFLDVALQVRQAAHVEH
ncbi:hypothetical protein D3C81_2264700 [compost metagenome]